MTCAPDVARLANLLAAAVEALQSQPTWFSGEGPPSDALGKDGDLYLDKLDTSIYLKEDGTWH